MVGGSGSQAISFWGRGGRRCCGVSRSTVADGGDQDSIESINASQSLLRMEGDAASSEVGETHEAFKNLL